MNKIKIPVKNKDWGFWTEDAITVYRKENDEIIWCNHEGYETETEEHTTHRIGERNLTWETIIDTCDKCQAYRMNDDDYWQEAPDEGIR